MINFIKKWLISLGSPPLFFKWASKILPWFFPISILILLIGLIWGIGFAPTDYKQGDVYRIIFIHVPSAILGQSIYLMMAIFGFICLIWRAKLAGMFLRSAAPIGASFTLIALVSGAVWGKPTWGTWWVWDARLTSMLILLIFYIAYILSWKLIKNYDLANKISSIIGIIGSFNLPIIK